MCTLREQMTLRWKIASQAPPDFVLVLGQNLQGARADGPQPDHSHAQGTLAGVGIRRSEFEVRDSSVQSYRESRNLFTLQ